jgi:hypothetical protein
VLIISYPTLGLAIHFFNSTLSAKNNDKQIDLIFFKKLKYLAIFILLFMSKLRHSIRYPEVNV